MMLIASMLVSVKALNGVAHTGCMISRPNAPWIFSPRCLSRHLVFVNGFPQIGMVVRDLLVLGGAQTLSFIFLCLEAGGSWALRTLVSVWRRFKTPNSKGGARERRGGKRRGREVGVVESSRGTHCTSTGVCRLVI